MRTLCRLILLRKSVNMAGPSPSPHKPRRKIKKLGATSNLSSTEALVQRLPSPWLLSSGQLGGSVSQWELLPLILMVVGLFRWAAGLWGYSGRCLTSLTLLLIVRRMPKLLTRI